MNKLRNYFNFITVYKSFNLEFHSRSHWLDKNKTDKAVSTFNVNAQTSKDLNIFNVKSNSDEMVEMSSDKISNYLVGKSKHYPPANKEWFNSIYGYNTSTIKLLPCADKITFSLIKSYFNFYTRKIEKKFKSLRLRKRARKLSTNRILVSRAELKHTNDKVIITIYVYNRQNKFYLNRIKRIASIDNIDNLLPNRIKKKIIKSRAPWPSNVKMELIKNKSLNLRSKINKQKNIIYKTLKIKNKKHYNKFKSYEIRYLKNYIFKYLRREISSVYHRQLILFNKSKFESKYLLSFTNLINRVYNKKVEFNLVNLKYLYLNSYIFSSVLVTKLRNRKNKLLTVLTNSLAMFNLPPMDRLAVYDEMYNRKKRLQNLKLKTLIDNISHSDASIDMHKDMLDYSLPKMIENNSTLNLKDHMYLYNPLSITNTIIKDIKYKDISGIRIEAAGRLTRRNVAERSVYKLRYKGNIKNMDSSFKRLPTVLLRGHEKSNLQYTNLYSKRRIGSFGVKGWVSSS